MNYMLNHKVDLMKILIHGIGPSDHSDWVSINRLLNKKDYTDRVRPTDILLSEIVNKFITSTTLAAMISQ